MKILLAISILALTLHAGIINTKHNLSTSGSGSIKATSEQEICVFCHTPHHTRPQGTPLWNRSMPASAYTMYDSEYLRRFNYPMPTALGSDNGTPGAISRQCLSCHDGTVAVGSVYIVRGTILGETLIDMVGLTAGMMTSANTGYIGTDLSVHHPVGIQYSTTPTVSFGVGTRNMELKATPDSPIKLYDYSGTKYVECSSCHDPHKENAKFLHVDSGSNHAQNAVTTCTACHSKDNWTGSIHQTATATYSDAAVNTKYGTNIVSDLGCINCHTPHNGEGKPYLLRQTQAQTCFQGAASSTAGAACHGVGGAKDIESVLSRSFVHPVIGSTVHTNLDTLYGTGVAKNPAGSYGIDWASSKHTVCMDCHNQHQATADKHVPDGQWYPTTGTNLVSGVLRGVPGVEPTWPSAWTQPTTFTTQLAATKEYQICMKCHSYWGLGAAVEGINTSGYVSPSDGTTPMTDLAWELSPNNKSAHPVVVAANDRTGSYAPKALVSVQMIAPWTNLGTQTMYCSDCHGSDNELGGDPRGPHGSNLKYILKGVNHYWPKKPDGVTLYTMDDLKNNTDQELFCKNCHNPDEPHTLWMNAMANKGFTCVQCHVAVPHGSPVSRLIGYGTFPAPYNYGGNSLAATGAGSGYRKDIYTDVDANDYYSTHASGGMCHPTNAGGYDANLMP